MFGNFSYLCLHWSKNANGSLVHCWKWGVQGYLIRRIKQSFLSSSLSVFSTWIFSFFFFVPYPFSSHFSHVFLLFIFLFLSPPFPKPFSYFFFSPRTSVTTQISSAFRKHFFLSHQPSPLNQLFFYTYEPSLATSMSFTTCLIISVP